jgi:hypothetical protein
VHSLATFAMLSDSGSWGSPMSNNSNSNNSDAFIGDTTANAVVFTDSESF